MGSRGLLRLATTRWPVEPVNAATSRLTWAPPPSSCQRLSSTLRSNSTCLKGLQNYHENTASLIRGSFRTQRQLTAHGASTKPFSSRAATGPGSEPGPGPAKGAARPRRRRLYYILALAAVTLATLPALDRLRNPDPRATLNKNLFTPCTVITNVPISASAFLLTIQLPQANAASSANNKNNDAIIAAAWRHGLWSVEVKQPQLQIARHYTPLPPSPLPVPSSISSSEEAATGQLQFYVRRYDGGEVSTYLSRLRPGDPIEIRGPHLGFDLATRLGGATADDDEEEEAAARGGRKVVFLAGGTGVAPALQAAAYVLGRQGVDVEVLWASRSAVDCAGCRRLPMVGQRRGWLWWWFFPRGTVAVDERHLQEEPSAVVRQLRELQAAYERHGRTLEVKCAVDEEAGMVGARDIMAAVGTSAHQRQDPASLSCHFHSQQQLEYSIEESDVLSNAGKDEARSVAAAPKCTCVGDGAKGKNLFIVSGPDGFVSAYVGPKVWAGGGERQGPVGGVTSQMMKEHPEIWKHWLVLKQ